MSYSICQRKYLLWAVFDDDDDELSSFKIREFRICFFDWVIRFQNKNKNTLFFEDIITDFFDAIPTDMISCDIFSLFGKITVICSKNALYHFFYKEDLIHDKLVDECLGYDIDMRCLYLL